MEQLVAEIAPTSTATTAETEPQVRAGIESAGGNPEMPVSIQVDRGGLTLTQTLLLIGGAAALGYAATRIFRS